MEMENKLDAGLKDNAQPVEPVVGVPMGYAPVGAAGYPMQPYAPYPSQPEHLATPIGFGTGDETYEVSDKGECTKLPHQKPPSGLFNWVFGGCWIYFSWVALFGAVAGFTSARWYMGFIGLAFFAGMIAVGVYSIKAALKYRAKRVPKITEDEIEEFLCKCVRDMNATLPQQRVIRAAFGQLNPEEAHEFHVYKIVHIVRPDRSYINKHVAGLYIGEGKRQKHRFRLVQPY